MKVSVNTTDNVMPGCPNTETPNESDVYQIPFQGAGLSAGYAKFYIFLREIPASSIIDLKILNPNGTTFNSWTYTVSTLNKISYWGFSKLLPTIDGIYTFQATYNGVTCSKNFTITHALNTSVLNMEEHISIYPNPLSNNLNVSIDSIENGEYSFLISNVMGQKIFSENGLVENNKIQKTFFFNDFAKGVYFLSIEYNGKKITKKLIKE